MGADAFRPNRGERLPRLGKEVAYHHRRMAHHVVQHAPALELPLPEPGRVRAAVLLRGARQVRPAGEGGAARPEQGAPRLDLWSEELILQVSGLQLGFRRQRRYFSRLAHVSGQRLLAGNTLELALAALDRIGDLLHVLDPRVVGTREPDGVDRGIGDHRRDGAVWLGGADVELPGEARRSAGVQSRGAPYADDVAIADLLKRPDVKLGVEATADHPDAQPLLIQPPPPGLYFLSHAS